jgi:hypothetical protein
MSSAIVDPPAKPRPRRQPSGDVQGFVLAEIAEMLGDDDPDLDPDEVARNLPMDELPTLARHLDHLFRCDQDAEFEYGLDLMIRGLEAKASNGG